MATSHILALAGRLIYYGASAYIWVVIARVLLSWLSPNPYSPVMRVLSRLTDPLLGRTRRLCPFTAGGLDFSPILAIFAVFLVAEVLGRGLMRMSLGAGPGVFVALAVLAVLGLLSSVTMLLIVLMLARVVISLVNANPYNPLVLVVYGATEPLLAPLRRFFPRGPGGLDWKALVWVVALALVWQMLAIAMGLFGASRLV